MSITRRVTTWLASSRGLFLSAVLAGSLCGVGFLGIGESSHTMTARFSDADGLVVGNEVRVAGVQAGTVQNIRIAVDPSNGAQYAEVDIQIDPSHWPLHQGTFVAVKPKGVLSNVFVQLDPGPAQNATLGNHPFFGVDQTQSPVNLDELSNVFTPDVTNSIRTQLQQGVLAFGGAGATDLNQTIYHANPLTLDAIPVTDVLATRSPQLDALNYEFDTISGDLAREDANLRPLIVNLNTTLNALAVREVELQGTLVHAANVFGDLSQALSSPATQDALARIFREGPQALSCASALTTQPGVRSWPPSTRTSSTTRREALTGCLASSSRQPVSTTGRTVASMPFASIPRCRPTAIAHRLRAASRPTITGTTTTAVSTRRRHRCR